MTSVWAPLMLAAKVELVVAAVVAALLMRSS